MDLIQHTPSRTHYLKYALQPIHDAFDASFSINGRTTTKYNQLYFPYPSRESDNLPNVVLEIPGDVFEVSSLLPLYLFTFCKLYPLPCGFLLLLSLPALVFNLNWHLILPSESHAPFNFSASFFFSRNRIIFNP